MTDLDPRIIALGYQGRPIKCTQEEYRSGLRDALQKQAATWIDQQQDMRAMFALNEVARLDKEYGYNPLS